MRSTILVLCVAALVASLAWFCHSRDYESFIALVVALIGTATTAFPHAASAAPRPAKIRHNDRYVYRRERVAAAVLPEVFNDFVRLFGQDIAGLPQEREWLKKNELIIWQVLRSDTRNQNKTPERVGFYEIIPLTRAATEAVEDGKKDGRTLRAADIAARRSNPSAFYVGSVGTTADIHAFKYITLRTLLEHFESLALAQPVTIYSRPVTNDGLRLLTKYEFRKLHKHRPDSESVWRRDLRKGESIRD